MRPRRFTCLFLVLFLGTTCAFTSNRFVNSNTSANAEEDRAAPFPVVPTPTDGGIREQVPKKLQERYRRWKEEFLSTEYGRAQWNKYAENKNFVLNIVVK